MSLEKQKDNEKNAKNFFPCFDIKGVPAIHRSCEPKKWDDYRYIISVGRRLMGTVRKSLRHNERARTLAKLLNNVDDDDDDN